MSYLSNTDAAQSISKAKIWERISQAVFIHIRISYRVSNFKKNYIKELSLPLNPIEQLVRVRI